MAKNSGLHGAKARADDEYYTMYRDVEQELVNYEDQLRGKVVYCNCDDVRYSNVLEYMCRVAPHIGIRKVIGSHYNPNGENSYYVTFVPPPNLDHWDGDDWERYLIEMPMEGDGDFRSEASIRLLQQADVVITNPPFSLFREYVAQLIKYNKKFLIIGNKNALSYKEIFPLIKDNKMWPGYTKPKDFKRPDNSIKPMPGMCWWFTNLNTTIRNQPQDLFLSYERRDREYPEYVNYNAIEISKAIEIPYDYFGLMGVPITWLDKYCPTQFEIINHSRYLQTNNIPEQFQKDYNDQGHVGRINPQDLVYYDKDHNTIVPYARVIIRRRRRE